MSRNAVKYQPFTALEGHKEYLEEKHKKFLDVEKPCLSSCDEQRINECLIEAIENQIPVIISIYKNRRIIELKSKIYKVYNGFLYLEDNKISINDIVNVVL